MTSSQPALSGHPGRRVFMVACSSVLAVGGASCNTYDPSSMPWPPTGQWHLTTKSAEADVTFGDAQQQCTLIKGSYGDYQDCGLVIPVSGHIRETSDGRDFALQGSALDKSGFNIYFHPVGSDGGSTGNIAGCVETGYAFSGNREAPDITGDLDVDCDSKPIAGRILISADEILWTRREAARLQRR